MKHLVQYMLESEQPTPFSRSKVKDIVYHCGHDNLSDDKFEDIVWFSDEPLDFFGKPEKYYVDIRKPLVIDAHGSDWADKIWHECCDEDGTPNIDPSDHKLIKYMPAWIWKMAQDSTDEYEYGDIPYMVKNKFGNKYDSVIIKNIYETPNSGIKVTDYCVFSMKQIKRIPNE